MLLIKITGDFRKSTQAQKKTREKDLEELRVSSLSPPNKHKERTGGGVGGGEPEEPVDAILPVTIKTGMQ